jgi:hypothetical protein
MEQTPQSCAGIVHVLRCTVCPGASMSPELYSALIDDLLDQTLVIEPVSPSASPGTVQAHNKNLSTTEEKLRKMLAHIETTRGALLCSYVVCLRFQLSKNIENIIIDILTNSILRHYFVLTTTCEMLISSSKCV